MRAARGPPGRGFPEEGRPRGRCSEGLRQDWASEVCEPKEVGGRDGVSAPSEGGGATAGALPLRGASYGAGKGPTSCLPHRTVGVLEARKENLQEPPREHLPPLLFLAPFSWSRRVSVVMQIRRCWPTPILSPLPASPLPPPMPTLTQPTGTAARHAWCPCPWLN